MQRKPLIAVPATSRDLRLSQPTVTSALAQLEKLGMVHEVTGRSRDRVFAYTDYLTILSEGTEPLPR